MQLKHVDINECLLLSIIRIQSSSILEPGVAMKMVSEKGYFKMVIPKKLEHFLPLY
jgi:hypothetical protein